MEQRPGEFTSPLKLFEYMAAGKPIVATGVPSVLEILRPGENSVVTPPDDEEKFIRALGCVLGDPGLCARISERARSDVAGYTWEKRVEKIIDGTESRLFLSGKKRIKFEFTAENTLRHG